MAGRRNCYLSVMRWSFCIISQRSATTPASGAGPGETTTSSLAYSSKLPTKRDNQLVLFLNGVIRQAVSQANELNGGQNVINYVDVDPGFKGHRWCVEGVKKPASSTLVSSAADESDSLVALRPDSQLLLPDVNTYNSTYGDPPDLVDVYWCDLARGRV
ncbi:uncharacterized protein BDW70DRAFT_163672 [Aspergillus foveolatus]|uniref:uncharacterized protein n=1 Tax=Aspergillus foveolatus TaxID=210207 RepID=UPI003CCD0422